MQELIKAPSRYTIKIKIRQLPSGSKDARPLLKEMKKGKEFFVIFDCSYQTSADVLKQVIKFYRYTGYSYKFYLTFSNVGDMCCCGFGFNIDPEQDLSNSTPKSYLLFPIQEETLHRLIGKGQNYDIYSLGFMLIQTIQITQNELK